jgi:hypothetical protein
VDTAASTSEASLLSNWASLPDGFTLDLPSDLRVRKPKALPLRKSYEMPLGTFLPTINSYAKDGRLVAKH